MGGGHIQRAIKPDIYETVRKEEADEFLSWETLAFALGLGFHSCTTKKENSSLSISRDKQALGSEGNGTRHQA